MALRAYLPTHGPRDTSVRWTNHTSARFAGQWVPAGSVSIFTEAGPPCRGHLFIQCPDLGLHGRQCVGTTIGETGGSGSHRASIDPTRRRRLSNCPPRRVGRCPARQTGGGSQRSGACGAEVRSVRTTKNAQAIDNQGQ
jgi:hypothetical protein